MIGFIVAFLVVIEIQIHSLKTTLTNYVDVRMHKDESLKQMSEKPKKHLTK
jgi:hypothetical protein